MGSESPALQLGPGPSTKRIGPRYGRQLRPRLESRPGEARAPPDSGVHHRDRPGRPGHSSRRNLMVNAHSDATLAKCQLFRGMNVSERHEFLAMLEGKSYAHGTTILEEGESFQFVWVILKGRCQVVKKSRSGEERELWVLEPGGVFGEMSFFNPAPHSATVRALSDVEVVR